MNIAKRIGSTLVFCGAIAGATIGFAAHHEGAGMQDPDIVRGSRQ
ncbi:MAG: hypothetical protein R3E50_03115 [Halioglobus sp.]